LKSFQGAKLQLQHIQGVLTVRDAFDKNIKDESRALKKSGHSDVRVGNLLRKNSIMSAEPDGYV
jgi:hypothetical protein